MSSSHLMPPSRELEVQGFLPCGRCEVTESLTSQESPQTSNLPHSTTPNDPIAHSSSPLPSHSPHPSAGLTPAHQEVSFSADDPVGDAVRIIAEAVASADPEVHYHLPPGGNHYRDHLGPEWYPYKPDQHISCLTLKDKSGNEVAAKYLHMGLHLGEPMLMGTMGYNRPVHSQPLHALPFHAPAPSRLILPSFRTLQHPFDPCIE